MAFALDINQPAESGIVDYSVTNIGGINVPEYPFKSADESVYTAVSNITSNMPLLLAIAGIGVAFIIFIKKR